MKKNKLKKNIKSCLFNCSSAWFGLEFIWLMGKSIKKNIYLFQKHVILKNHYKTSLVFVRSRKKKKSNLVLKENEMNSNQLCYYERNDYK